MKVLGIDIGSYSIKIAELNASTKGYSFHRFQEIKLSLDPNADRGLEIIDHLRSLAAHYDPNSTHWVIGLPQHHVSVHHKRFPFRERLKIIKSLPFELEDEIPLDIDDTIYDAKNVEYIGQATDVLAIACPKESIQETLNVAKDGGFDPEIVSVEGLALANLFENWQSAPPEVSPNVRQIDELTSVGVTTPQESKIILHVGHKRSILLVYRENGLVAVRSLLWGGSEIAEDISKAFGISSYEAMTVLNKKSFVLMNSAGATKEQLLLSKTITGSIDKLMHELKLTLLEVRAAFNLEYQEFALSGGVGQVQNICAYFTQALEIPVNIAHPLQKMNNVDFEMSTDVECAAPVALGLAIEALKRPRNPAINLRKDEFARENLAFKRFWEQWRVPIQTIAVAFVLFVFYSIVRESIATDLLETIDDKITDVAKSEAQLKGSAATESGVRKFIRTHKKELQLRKDLDQLNTYVSAMDVLAKISEKLPVVLPPQPGQGIDVSHLDINNDLVIIEGRVQGPLLAQIESAIKNISQPKSVENVSPSANVKPGAGTPFGFRFKIKRQD